MDALRGGASCKLRGAELELFTDQAAPPSYQGVNVLTTVSDWRSRFCLTAN